MGPKSLGEVQLRVKAASDRLPAFQVTPSARPARTRVVPRRHLGSAFVVSRCGFLVAELRPQLFEQPENMQARSAWGRKC